MVNIGPLYFPAEEAAGAVVGPRNRLSLRIATLAVVFFTILTINHGKYLAAQESEKELQSAAVEETEPVWQLETWEKPFDYQSDSRFLKYRPLTKASRKWRICAAYPHLKDSYWLSVNYGMVEEARRLGVALQVVEAGGYPNLENQIAQIRSCTADGKADILALGTVSFRGLSEAVLDISETIPVIAVVNDIANPGISAKVGVSWISMGQFVGEYLAERHPRGSAPVKVAWFPGPQNSGWAPFVEEGFRAGLGDSAVEVVVTKWGDTGREVQVILVEEALEERPDIDYIVGSAVTAEAALSVLRARGLSDEIQVLADYFTHAVYRGIKRGRILAAPTDRPILQGRLGIEMAVRLLEDQVSVKHLGPAIRMVEGNNVEALGPDESLAPASFKPTFVVE
jgi:protein TorT